MKIATMVLTHDNVELTRDTVHSIQSWVGERIIVLVDQIGWPQFQNFRGAEKGFLHAHKRSPYRNYALGLKRLYQYWHDSDWFLYSEYDCLFASSQFKEDLRRAEDRNAWVVGVDLRRFDFKLPALESILGQGRIERSYYFLGCCQFLHRKFLTRMHDINFLDSLLEQTRDYEKGYFPDYDRWAFEEDLWPTVAAKLGGALYELVCWKGGSGEWQTVKVNDPNVFYAGAEHSRWRGRFKRYPIRNSPEIATLDMQPETSIAHPIKDLNSPIRAHQRARRKRLIF